MSIVYDNTIKTARLTATKDTVTSGTLVIQDAGDAVLATFTLNATAGSVATDVWTLGFTATTVSAGASGTASKAEIRDSGTTARITGLTVGTAATDIIIDNTSINSGQNVTVTTAAITHAA